MSVLPHIPALFLAVAQEAPVLTGVHVRMDGNEEALVKLEGTRELFWQLPHTLEKLIDDRGHLFGITIQVGVPAETELSLYCHAQ